jgi:enoyl-CoA hydratase/carnithine racemase
VLRRSDDGHVTWLTFDRPERLNSFTAADYRELRTAIEASLRDDGIRVVVLTGNGRAFSAGADRSLVDGTATPAQRAEAGREFTAFVEVLQHCEKPLLTAVNGLAVGIGCTMLLYCDLVLAASSARFRLPFTTLGLVPEAGSSALLPARGPWGDVAWAALSSEWLNADEARTLGLVWRVVPDLSLLERTAAAAAMLAALDPDAVQATKRLLTAGLAAAAGAAMVREDAEMRSLTRHRDPDSVSRTLGPLW